MTTKDDIITAMDGLGAAQLNTVAILVAELKLGKGHKPFDGIFRHLCETDKTNPIPLKVNVETIGFKGLIKLACELNVPHDDYSQWLNDEWSDKEDELRVAVAEAMERRTK